jgi:hypothetical protein
MITVKAKYNIDLGKSVTNANADLLNGTLNESGTITTFTPIKVITGSGNNFNQASIVNSREVRIASISNIDIATNSNDTAITNTNSYTKPRRYAGGYSLNYFRNIYKFEDEEYNPDYLKVIDDTHTPPEYNNNEQGKYNNYQHGGGFNKVNPYDDQSLVYGRYFVARFILNRDINFKLENVTFITSPYQ